jgi:hypothetical protein
MRFDRAAWVALGLLVLGFGAFELYRHGPGGVPWLPVCVFHHFTGLACPGCGMTRAASACLHGEIGRAFRFNPLGMALLPMAAIGLGLETAGRVRGRPLPFRFNLEPRGVRALALLMLAFWILRNVPVWPLTLLAPP